MLLLVSAHGDEIRLVEEDIRRHQGGIGEEASVDVVRVLGRLVLELGHAGELAEHGVAVQHPAKLSVGGNVGLDEEDVLLRVQAAGDVSRQLGDGMAAQLRRHLPDGDGVHIRHHIVAVILVRESRPVADRAEIGAQGQVAGGLDAAQNPLSLHVLFHASTPHIVNLRILFQADGAGGRKKFQTGTEDRLR